MDEINNLINNIINEKTEVAKKAKAQLSIKKKTINEDFIINNKYLGVTNKENLIKLLRKLNEYHLEWMSKVRNLISTGNFNMANDTISDDFMNSKFGICLFADGLVLISFKEYYILDRLCCKVYKIYHEIWILFENKIKTKNYFKQQNQLKLKKKRIQALHKDMLKLSDEIQNCLSSMIDKINNLSETEINSLHTSMSVSNYKNLT